MCKKCHFDKKFFNVIMKTLSAQFDEMIVFARVVFFHEIWRFYTKSNIFNLLRKFFIFSCQHPFSHELSVFICIIVMDKLMFCTLSWTFRPRFGLLLKLGAPKKLRIFCLLEMFTLFCTTLLKITFGK